jgi:hypothetical protein
MDAIKKRIKLPDPYQQGDLDSLCGVYCVVNAVSRLCGPLSEDKATELFESIVEFLETRSPLVERILAGTALTEIGGVLGQVVAHQYPIQRCKAFHGFPKVSRHFFWDHIQDFMDNYEGVVLTAIGGHHDHWTLIHKATDRTFNLYDSGGIHRLYRAHCTLDQKNPENHRHILYPTHTYFLWVDNP